MVVSKKHKTWQKFVNVGNRTVPSSGKDSHNFDHAYGARWLFASLEQWLLRDASASLRAGCRLMVSGGESETKPVLFNSLPCLSGPLQREMAVQLQKLRRY